MKTAVFLYNPESGKGKIARNVGCISTIFQAYGYDVTPQRIDFTANPFDGNETIDLMVVAGGDGTVNYAVNAMKRKGLDIPIGVIPAGTANDFAGAVGMSREPLEAARQIASGSVERVDCGRVNDLYFVNIFSFGIFTTTSQRTPDERKHKIGKLAYIIEGVKEFRTMHAVPLEIEADGERFDLRSLMVLIFNGETAGGFHLARRSSIKDGHPAGEEEFLSFDAGHVPLSGGRQPEDRPPPPGAADRHPFVGQRTHGRRRAEGRRIPAAHRVSGGRPARDVRQTGLGQFLIFTVRLV